MDGRERKKKKEKEANKDYMQNLSGLSIGKVWKKIIKTRQVDTQSDHIECQFLSHN